MRYLEIDELKNKIKTLYDTINNFKDSLTLKDDQLSTMQSTLILKDDQIKTLQNSLNLKEEKITTLEKTIKLKEDDLNTLKENSTDKALLKDKEILLKDKEKEINDLRKEAGILQNELTKADEEFDHLEQENEKLRKDLAESSDLKIIDFTNANITKDDIIEKMHEILQKSLHSATITVPDISDLQKLRLYEVRSSVNIKISCSIDPEIEGNTDLLEEYQSLDNISLRNFEGNDRYIINRDGEELMIAIIGKEENNHLAFYSKDPSHITLFSSIVMEGWLRSRKI